MDRLPALRRRSTTTQPYVTAPVRAAHNGTYVPLDEPHIMPVMGGVGDTVGRALVRARASPCEVSRNGPQVDQRQLPIRKTTLEIALPPKKTLLDSGGSSSLGNGGNSQPPTHNGRMSNRVVNGGRRHSLLGYAGDLYPYPWWLSGRVGEAWF